MTSMKQKALIWATGMILAQGLASAATDTNAASSAAITAPASAATGGTDSITALFGDPVVAKGKGVEVKQSELDAAVISERSALALQGRAIAPENQLLERRNLLDQLVSLKLILDKATDADKAAGRAKYEESVKNFMTSRHLTNDEDFHKVMERQLKATGQTMESWERDTINQLTASLVVEHELKTAVTDADVKKFYDANSSRFEQPEMVRVSHILLSVKDKSDMNPDPTQQRDIPDADKAAKRKQIEDLRKRALAGEDFSKLVKDYSEDPGKVENNGEYLLSRMDSFVPEFIATAFALTNNQVSDVITTIFGYHVLKLIEKIPSTILGLDDEVVATPGGYLMLKRYWKGPAEDAPKSARVSAVIRENLDAQQRQQQIPDFLDKLKKEADVQILDDKLKGIEPASMMPVQIPQGAPANR